MPEKLFRMPILQLKEYAWVIHKLLPRIKYSHDNVLSNGSGDMENLSCRRKYTPGILATFGR